MTSTLLPTREPDSDGPRRGRGAALVAGLVVVALLLAGGAAWFATGGTDGPIGDVISPPPVEPAAITVTGLADAALLSAADLATVELTVSTEEDWADSLVVTLDGDPVTATGGVATIGATTLGELADGEHTVEITAGTGEAAATTSLTFTIDTTAPVVTLPAEIEAEGRRTPLTVVVGVDDADQVTVEGAEVVRDGASVTATWAIPPESVVVEVTDAAGNAARAEQPVIVHFPGGRAVHVTPSAWRYAPKREPVIAMLEAGLIDAVQMDIKDELGDVSWDTDVAWADLSGAEDFNRNFDMAAAIETIHSYGARVIGRLVVYRDHRLAQWAWESGQTDLVVQGTDGLPYAGRYGEYAFTNFAHPDVQQYNLDIALEAVELGFDDVLYDYIRRPDGAIEKLVIPGIGDRTPEEAVVEVMATAYPLLRERGVWVGASVFGIAIDRPTQMAQDIPMMAPHVDYISPMVYPNHWNLGEYDVPVPEDAPYDIVERSLTLYHEVLEPTGTALMPWLQDFGGYGEAEVRAQIDATEAVTGERSFLLWASSAEYTAEALDPIEPPATP